MQTQTESPIRDQLIRILGDKGVQEQDNLLLFMYRGFQVIADISDRQPLVTFKFYKDVPITRMQKRLWQANILNLNSQFGSHTVDTEQRYYLFRSGNYLPRRPSNRLLRQILADCALEAEYGFRRIASIPKGESII